MAARNAKRSISMILRKNRGLWTVYSKSVGKNMHFFVFCCCPLFLFGLNLLLQEVEPNSVSRYFVSRLQKSPYFCVFKYTVRKNSSYPAITLLWTNIEKKTTVLQSILLVQMSIGHRENGAVLVRHLPCEQRPLRSSQVSLGTSKGLCLQGSFD